MLKFGTPTIALPLAIKKCTVQTGCTVCVIGKAICTNSIEVCMYVCRQMTLPILDYDFPIT